MVIETQFARDLVILKAIHFINSKISIEPVSNMRIKRSFLAEPFLNHIKCVSVCRRTFRLGVTFGAARCDQRARMSIHMKFMLTLAITADNEKTSKNGKVV